MSDLNDVIDELADVEALKAKERRVLSQLLDKEGGQERKYLALRGYMGTTLAKSGSPTAVPSYSSMHTLEWIGSKGLYMGSEMDFMKTAIDPDTGKLVIDEASAEEMKQRAPDWSRQADLTTYLIQETYHKFGTILAVVCPAWVDDPGHENWGRNGRALVNAIKFEALDSRGNVGLLDLNETKVYALDGQHRVMGIRGLLDIQDGGLTLKAKDGKEKKQRITKEEFLQKVHSNVTKFAALFNEKINVEYIPSVIAGETREEASRRIRSVFVAINHYAKKTDKGENILLEENDGYSIVARRLGHHGLFIDQDGKGRVNWKNASISKTEQQNITTLQALKTCVDEYVTLYKEISWKPLFNNAVSIRPSDDELDIVEDEMKAILDVISNLPVFVSLQSGDSLKELREFPDESNPDNQGHLLLRPIGLPLLFKAISNVLHEGALTIDKIIKKLIKFDKEGGFVTFKPGSIWYKVTYDPDKKKMITTTSNQATASKLLRYMIEGADAQGRESLIHELVSCRRVSESKWINYEGEIETINYDEIDLPLPIKLR